MIPWKDSINLVIPGKNMTEKNRGLITHFPKLTGTKKIIKQYFLTGFFSVEDWQQYLVDVKPKLGLRHDSSFLDGKLVTFLKKKRKSNDLGGKVMSLEIFNEIIPSIYNIYQDMLKDNIEDEFEQDVAQGTPSLDLLFFENYFLPCCILFMYKEWLQKNEFEEGDIYENLFTIGSGSCSINLTPEVHGFCRECAPEVGAIYGSLKESEIKAFNTIVFRKQKNDKFFNQALRDMMNEDASSSEDVLHCNPFESSEELDGYQCNPFESSDENNESLDLDGCDVCWQSFPSPEFVALHKKIFHSTKSVQPVYVEEAEELMTSFIVPDKNQKVNKKKIPLKSSASENDKNLSKERSSKYPLRRRLNM